jgi:para-nitrobenzyl esterase
MGRKIRAGLRAIGTALLACMAMACGMSASAAPQRVDGGLVEGVALPSGVRAWLGVPFAAPPVRELRWKPPQPVRPWSGVRHAERAAPMCLQALRSRTMNHYFGDEAISEDCLYLNIWAPARGAKLPVIVWIYGGGFNVGSASMANYSGEGLARQGVVRVNIAYRLGALGFLAHPDLSRENGGASGNQGLADQVAALKWVQRNIAAFGGDPGNVTIVGQSAGSMSVSMLQASAAAKGLFQRAVGMSGSHFAAPAVPVALAQGEAEGLALQKALGVQSIEAMRDIAGDRILAISASVPRASIVFDGTLVERPQEVYAARRQNDVPLMLGFTRDESFRSLGTVDSLQQLQAAVKREFPGNAQSILAAYPASDATAARVATDIGRDASLGVQMFAWAKAQQQSGRAPVFAYFFTRRQPYSPGITFIDHDPATAGAYHTGEVPYFLRTRDALNLFRRTRDWEPADELLEARMSQLLLSFARTGRPAATDVPAWPSFDASRPEVLVLGTDVRMEAWPDFASLALLEAPAPARTNAPRTESRPRD